MHRPGPQPIPTALIASPDYPPFSSSPDALRASELAIALTARGVHTEVVSDSPGTEELMHLGVEDILVHRVAPGASRTRLYRKLLELRFLWNRDLTWIRWHDRIAPPRGLGLPSLDVQGLDPRVAADRVASHVGLQGPTTAGSGPVKSIDLICCTYNRVAEPVRSVPTFLREAGAARESGLLVRVLLVHQTENFTDQLLHQRPGWRSELVFQMSAPPGLPRARNAAISASAADLLVFVDDDVELDPGCLTAYAKAAEAHPGVSGFAGRIRSRIEGPERENHSVEVGQIRPSGAVTDNFDSVGAPELTVSPHSPRGANMAFRRERMTAFFGTRWFDDSLERSAHREETTLGVEMFRRALSSAFVPAASLLHFESETGGCENRGSRSLRQRRDHLALDHLFLNRLYEPLGAIGRLASLGLVAREFLEATTLKARLVNGGLAAVSLSQGRRLYAKSRDLE